MPINDVMPTDLRKILALKVPVIVQLGEHDAEPSIVVHLLLGRLGNRLAVRHTADRHRQRFLGTVSPHHDRHFIIGFGLGDDAWQSAHVLDGSTVEAKDDVARLNAGLLGR